MNHPDIDTDRVMKRLEDQRAALVEQRIESSETRASTDRSPAALQHPAVTEEEEERRRQTMRRIDSALDRLDRNEFGQCQACGERISAQRLERDPLVSECTDCADGRYIERPIAHT
ncbi:TraR/DksA C4-type zinc finger protein [Halomonas elongata]|uniref:TraR/DksA C4-type zinc finger protein n=1 Tax=Halomonas elongata TaxID=2746 RepID=UPI0023AF5C44|nr:hypothetical protein [Halomonas elongata]